jgi:FkbM family methyltransferase
VSRLPPSAREPISRALLRAADAVALACFWPAARLSSSALVEAYVRSVSGVVRAVPLNNLKRGFVARSLALAGHQFDFVFESRIGVLWTAAAFPDLLTRHMMFEGMYQQDVLIALKTLIRAGDTVFDIGGHHGLMAVISALATGAKGSVFTFEPNPGARRYLEQHLALNGVQNVTVEDVAITDGDGLRAFYIQEGDVSWNSTIVPELSDSGRFGKSITVHTTSVDSYVERTQRVPQVIKIDAEGSELLVLRGAEQTLRRHRPVLIMEFNPASAHAAGFTVGDCVAFLESLSYELTVMKSDSRGYYRFERQEPFEEAKHAREPHLANVICLPQAGAGR